MTKIFWVTCPQCKGEFYCHYQELRQARKSSFSAPIVATSSSTKRVLKSSSEVIGDSEQRAVGKVQSTAKTSEDGMKKTVFGLALSAMLFAVCVPGSATRSSQRKSRTRS